MSISELSGRKMWTKEQLIDSINRGERSFDAIVIGAGITGATIASILKDPWNVLVIDRREVIGGNCADYRKDNYFVHKYGPHIFHTSDEEVWDHANRHTRFNRFVNCPIVQASDGRIYNLPFNMNLFSKLFGINIPLEVKSYLQNQIQKDKESLNIIDPKNLEEQAISLVGKKIYELFIKEYTEKQWGTSCKNLDKDIIKRLPLRFTYNNNYFNDTYQGIPIDGYSKMIESMLTYCSLMLNTDFNEIKDTVLKYSNEYGVPIIYTGQIDELFDFKYGHLPWRSLHFDTKECDCSNMIGNAVCNYATHSVPYTRMIEHKHFTCLNESDVNESSTTIVTYEYPVDWKPGMDAYYPVNNEASARLKEKYDEEVLKYPNLAMLGRLAEYKYKDMAPSMKDAIELGNRIKEFIKEQKSI